MSPTARPLLTLERVLMVDAASGLAMASLLFAATPALAAATNLGEGLLFEASLVLVPSAALMLVAARFPSLTAPLGWLVVAGNVLWILASIGVMVALKLTPLGHALVLLQAAFVAVVTALEARGLASRPTNVPARG